MLPKARADFRLPAEEYALRLEDYGIDIPPGEVAVMAHQAFSDIQAEMQPIAAQIAKNRNLPSSDYRDVMHELKKQQLVGESILPFYQERLKQIEKIIVDKQIVSLPDRPARIRIATAAETAEQPAPHMSAPPFVHNTGQKEEFVLPLNIPAGPGQTASEQYDDFTFDAAAWTLTAHEARPGHELQLIRCWNMEFRWPAYATLSTVLTLKAGDFIRNISSGLTCRWKSTGIARLPADAGGEGLS